VTDRTWPPREKPPPPPPPPRPATPPPLPSPAPPRGFGRLPIQRWFLIRSLALLAVLIVGGTVTAVTLQRTAEVRDTLVDVIEPVTHGTLELVTAQAREQSAIREFGLTGDERHRYVYADARRAAEAAMRDILRLVPRLPDGGELQRDVERLRLSIERWRREYAERVFAGTAEYDDAAGQRQIDAIKAALQEQQADLRRLHQEGRERLHGYWRTVYLALGAIAALLVVAMIANSVIVRYAVVRPVRQLARQVKAVADGDFEHELAVDRPAELSDLSARVDAMRQRILGEWRDAAEAQRRLHEQTLELRRSNAELEQFAYVASHDLQEPLRKIAGFTRLLEQRYGDRLDDRARQYIAFAVDGAKRMQKLINDLLDFSRVGRIAGRLEEVDCEDALTVVLESLGAQIEEAGATVTHDPLPAVRGSRTLLCQLFQNLIGNAIKFRSEEPPRIHVGVRRAGAMWEFSCADNGIGIDAKYADRVFLIFQRLHGRDAYPGTGIGLALCKKIVEYHGGTIWVEPNPGGPGTTLRWTLPATNDVNGERSAGRGAGHPPDRTAAGHAGEPGARPGTGTGAAVPLAPTGSPGRTGKARDRTPNNGSARGGAPPDTSPGGDDARPAAD